MRHPRQAHILELTLGRCYPEHAHYIIYVMYTKSNTRALPDYTGVLHFRSDRMNKNMCQLNIYKLSSLR